MQPHFKFPAAKYEIAIVVLLMRYNNAIEIPLDIQDFLDTLRSALPEIETIWLIGSRANPTSRPPRDWDFLIFTKPICLAKVEALSHYRQDNIDVLVVRDEGDFEELWFVPSPERQKPKRGSLTDWEWQVVSSTEACYVGAKARTNSPHVDLKEKSAICLWRAPLSSIDPQRDIN